MHVPSLNIMLHSAVHSLVTDMRALFSPGMMKLVRACGGKFVMVRVAFAEEVMVCPLGMVTLIGLCLGLFV